VRDDVADEAAEPAPISVNKDQIEGEPIVVRVLRHEPAMRISIMGSAGNELASTDVSADEASVVLPGVTGSAGRVAIVTTFARGFGSETVLRPIALHAGGS
jgi:hypothetical protein